MSNLTRERRRPLASIMLAGALLIGGVALVIGGSATGAGAATACSGSQTANVVERVGTTYVVGATTGVTFTVGASSISWVPTTGQTVKSLSTTYVKGSASSTSTSSPPGSQSVPKVTTRGTLTSLTVCTAPATPPPPPPIANCSSGQGKNVVTLGGSGYSVISDPTVEFTLTPTKVTWTLDTGHMQKTVATTYVKTTSNGTSSYGSSGTSSATSVDKTTSKGDLVSLTVCTAVTPPPNPNPDPNPAPSCANGGVQNNAQRAGSVYVDGGSPGLTFSNLSSGSSLEWDLLPGVTQYKVTAVYENGLLKTLAPGSDSISKTSGSRKLLVVSVCTSAPT